MKKQFVSYELALKLKELGFDLECYAYFVKRKLPTLIYDINGINNSYLGEQCYAAPLWQQAFEFFQEKEIGSWIEFGCYSKKFIYHIVYWKDGDPHVINSEKYETKIEAQEVCLTKLIEIYDTQRNSETSARNESI